MLIKFEHPITIRMHFSVGSTSHSYQPNITADTTAAHYWLNWRVCLCALWILISMILASFLIWKYEGKSRCKEEERAQDEELSGVVYEDELWMPCLKVIHPIWLLAFRVLSFFLLLALLATNVVYGGGNIFLYYTQWTFMLVIVHFGLGSMLSIYGCCQYLNRTVSSNNFEEDRRVDAESRIYAASISDISETDRRATKNSVFCVEQDHVRKPAGVWGYVFQVIYQTNAGAVLLTDCVFWFIIFPFLLMKDYDLNFILIGMHTMNAILLLGDTALNSLRFPWFRISYFLFWTSGFVIFQWLLHAFVLIWWPYPFLDLASAQAPMWYLTVALMHIPCYAIFALIIKMKHHVLSRWFPQSNLINCRG